MSTSKQLIIFEGPDGGGKSTVAKLFADTIDAEYVHMGPFRNVGTGLGRMFVDAMMPAVRGYRSVVMDRCWISEKPYADAFREGKNRIQFTRTLDRLALRCGAQVFLCLPSWETVKSTFESRNGIEYLDNADQLRHVYDYYGSGKLTDLPIHTINRDITPVLEAVAVVASFVSDPEETALMPLHWPGAGRADAQILIVGDEPGPHQDQDPLYQWPFGSMSASSCCRWLSLRMDQAGLDEHQFCWINAKSASTEVLREMAGGKKVVALGLDAMHILNEAGIKVNEGAGHPQFWRRFKNHAPYPLIDILKRLCNEVV